MRIQLISHRLRAEFLTILTRESQVMIQNWIDSRNPSAKQSMVEMKNRRSNELSENDGDELDVHQDDTDALLSDDQESAD